MKASEILDLYIKFFEEREHKRIANSPLVPENDPTTLFTSSGMQPLVPYLLGEKHPSGPRLVNVQNSFRAQDIDEIGDNRHTTFFRMLGNWSLGDYFKSEQIPWLWEFLTKQLNIDKQRLYVTVFDGLTAGRHGNDNIPKDTESEEIWRGIFEKENLNPDERIFFYGVEKNWWSRSGPPEKMPIGEPGGPDTEVFYEFDTEHDAKFGTRCHVNCDCGKYLEIANSVFMQYKKTENGFEDLPQKNVDFGGGLERLVAATENKSDVFETSLFAPVINSIEMATSKKYTENKKEMRIIADHLIASSFIIANNIVPSNKEQGYVLRRLIRRAVDNFELLGGQSFNPILEQVVENYKDTDEYLVDKFEIIKSTLLEEEQKYKRTRSEAKKMIDRELAKSGKKEGDELMGTVYISPELAFKSLASLGLGPTQLKSLGYSFDEQALAEQIKKHQVISRSGASQKFAGGLADHSEGTIKGHTATHLLHKALRDLLGEQLHQTGSNITSERLRFDFNFDRKLTDDEIKSVEDKVNEKIKENLPVHFEMLKAEEAKKIGAIGLFDEKYQEDVKVYFIGNPHTSPSPQEGEGNYEGYYSREFCGGPHVNSTGELKSFRIIKEESLGRNNRRIYAKVD